jgi:hypothetical protein
MRYGGIVLLAALYLCARIKITLATPDTNHPVTDSTQTISRFFNPKASWFCNKVSTARCRQGRYVRWNDQVIDNLRFIYLFIFSGCAAQHGLQPPPHTRFLYHTQRRATVDRTPLGLVINSLQRPLPDNTHTQQTNIYVPDWIRTHDRSRRAAVDLRLRPRGHWDRR